MMKIEGLSCVWETGIVGRMHWNTELTCFLVGDSFYEFAMFFIWLLNCFFFVSNVVFNSVRLYWRIYNSLQVFLSAWLIFIQL